MYIEYQVIYHPSRPYFRTPDPLSGLDSAKVTLADGKDTIKKVKDCQGQGGLEHKYHVSILLGMIIHPNWLIWYVSEGLTSPTRNSVKHKQNGPAWALNGEGKWIILLRDPYKETQCMPPNMPTTLWSYTWLEAAVRQIRRSCDPQWPTDCINVHHVQWYSMIQYKHQ